MKFTKSQIFYLPFMNYSILNLQLSHLMIDTAKKDLWISTLLSSVFGLIAALILAHLEKKYPGQTWLETLQTGIIGKGIFWVVIPITILYMLMLSVYTATALAEFISIGFLQETPFPLITVVLAFTIAYSVKKSLIDLANMAGVFTLISIVSGWTMSFSLSGQRHLQFLYPAFEQGITPVLVGAVLFVPIWAELFFLFFLPKRTNYKRSWLLTYVLIVIANVVVFEGHSVGAITVFGLKQSENLNFPMLSSVKAISLGFIDRFDVYGLILMIIGSFIRVMMYYQMAMMIVQYLFSKRKIRVASWVNRTFALALLSSGSILLFRNTASFHQIAIPFVIGGVAMFAIYILVSIYALIPKTN